MKKLLLIILINIGITAWAIDTYYENGLSFYSPEVLAQGNTFVAEANGLASFEYNPAGLTGESSFTLFSANMNLISNLVQLSDDILLEYNDDEGTSLTGIDLDVLSYLLDPDNRVSLITALLNQVSEPYGDSIYANGLGAASALSMGFTGNGFGIGLSMSLDYEVYGNELLTSELNSVITTSLLLGYGRTLNLGIISLDLGVAARPTYKIRSNSALTPVVDMLLEDTISLTSSDFMEDLDYLTGIGVGIDAGAKVHFMDLTVGLAVLDIGGTNTVYYENSYENIINGTLLGTEKVLDEYVTPATLKFGLSYNPSLWALFDIINPTIALDYSLEFIDEGTFEDYANQGSFWNNLSLGTELEIVSMVSLRAGLNQGYVTLGVGLELFIFELDAAVYSYELGEDVGDRQQMGAVVEFGIRF